MSHAIDTYRKLCKLVLPQPPIDIPRIAGITETAPQSSADIPDEVTGGHFINIAPQHDVRQLYLKTSW
jgi:hypothetical protein